MSKMNFGKSKFSRFISSKGFYVALALCLVGAGGATWMAVNHTISGIERQNNQMLESEKQFSDFPLLEETEKTVPDVPKQYSAPSSSSTEQSGQPEQPQPSPEPEAPSDEPVASPVTPTLVYTLPVPGQVINGYSDGELVKNVTLGDWRTHDGVDFAAARGEDVYAVADGTVTDIRNDPIWGCVVTVRHGDGHESVYCGLDKTLPVAVGDNVMLKQVIGKLDGVPCEINSDSHLHFAMRKDGRWIDPMSVIAKAVTE